MALILGVQMKMTMLIQHAEKKENWSSTRYMSKWSFDKGTLVTEWNTVHCWLHWTMKNYWFDQSLHHIILFIYFIYLFIYWRNSIRQLKLFTLFFLFKYLPDVPNARTLLFGKCFVVSYS